MSTQHSAISPHVLINKEGAAAVPTEIQVIPAGQHHTERGDFLLDETAAAAVVAEFAAKQNDLVVDYEHQTLSGKEAPAAGWIKKLINKGVEGIWAVVEWTERAKQYIAAKEYRYLSPVFLVRSSDRRVARLAHVGLTNDPAIDGMMPLVNKNFELRISNVEFQKESDMRQIFAVLGLKDDATEAQAVAAVEALKAAAAAGALVANKRVLETLGLKDGASESEVTGTIMAMKQAHDQQGSLAQKVETLTKNLAQRDASDLVALAMKDGKITPAEAEWALDYARKDPEGFKIYVAKTNVKIHLGDVSGAQKPAGAPGGLDETQLQINKQLGLDAETFKKYNAA